MSDAVQPMPTNGLVVGPWKMHAGYRQKLGPDEFLTHIWSHVGGQGWACSCVPVSGEPVMRVFKSYADLKATLAPLGSFLSDL